MKYTGENIIFNNLNPLTFFNLINGKQLSLIIQLYFQLNHIHNFKICLAIQSHIIFFYSVIFIIEFLGKTENFLKSDYWFKTILNISVLLIIFDNEKR